MCLEELDLLMNTEGNFRHYRMLLEKSKPPVVPYLGLLLTDLTFLDDANLTETGKVCTMIDCVIEVVDRVISNGFVD